MPVVLKLDSRPSLYEPQRVEIDGKMFTIKELTLGSLERIQEIQPDLQAGSGAAIRKALEMLLEGEIALLKDLPLRKIKLLVETLVQRAINPTDEEKNGSGPGPGSAA